LEVFIRGCGMNAIGRLGFLLAVFLLQLAFLFNCALSATDSTATKPVPKAVKLEVGEKSYMRILGGPPESLALRSGLVILQPQKTVGKHSTEKYEELIIVLEGQGKMMITGGASLEMKPGVALYCPPDTEHNVLNTGSGILKYVYVVAKTR
jgi:quercetin dioxygenase-like cupin family protein